MIYNNSPPQQLQNAWVYKMHHFCWWYDTGVFDQDWSDGTSNLGLDQNHKNETKQSVRAN